MRYTYQILLGIALTLIGLITALLSLTPSRFIIDDYGQIVIGADGVSFLDIRNITSIYESYEITEIRLNTTLKCDGKVKLLLINSTNAIVGEVDLVPNNTTLINVKHTSELSIITFIGPEKCCINYTYIIYGFEYSNLWLAIPGFALGIAGGYMGIRGIMEMMTKRER